MHTEHLILPAPDGTSLGAYVARPDPLSSTPCPPAGGVRGVIVLQEIFGVNAHIRSVAERFAEAGFIAIAPDMFHRTAPKFEGSYDDLAGGRTHAFALTPAGVQADLQAAAAWLDEQGAAGQLAAVGFCLGGALSLVANAYLPLRCAVSYYGNPGYARQLAGDDLVARLHGPQLLLWAGRDTFIDSAARGKLVEEMRAAGHAFTDVELSYADHGFHCDARASYHPEAAAVAWATTLAFLRQPRG